LLSRTFALVARSTSAQSTVIEIFLATFPQELPP
jgi:hypothetical protein